MHKVISPGDFLLSAAVVVAIAMSRRVLPVGFFYLVYSVIIAETMSVLLLCPRDPRGTALSLNRLSLFLEDILSFWL